MWRYGESGLAVDDGWGDVIGGDTGRRVGGGEVVMDIKEFDEVEG